MKRFVQGEYRGQTTLLPESLDDYVADTNPVRVVDVFVNELDLGRLGFDSIVPAETGRPAYHSAVLLKIYIYGYHNRIQSSRQLEREAQRNVELMWLTGRLTPDFKTIANFRKDNGKAIRGVCRQPMQYLASGDVVMTSALNGRVFSAQESGANIKIIWQDSIYDIDSWQDPRAARTNWPPKNSSIFPYGLSTRNCTRKSSAKAHQRPHSSSAGEEPG